MTPTAEQVSRFHEDGYLLLERFLDEDHVARLTATLSRAVARRREAHAAGRPTVGMTQVDGDHTRIYYLLDEDPEFLDLLDFAPTLAYIHALFDEQPHFHASDAFWQEGAQDSGPGWHQDGSHFYRDMEKPTPLLQLKIGYFLSDMTEPDQGNLMVVPGSHRDDANAPSEDQTADFGAMPGAVQVCCPPGSALMFHNALWHTGGPSRRADGRRYLLYYAYEHRWMIASPEPVSYPREFYRRLDDRLRPLFHPFVFDRF